MIGYIYGMVALISFVMFVGILFADFQGQFDDKDFNIRMYNSDRWAAILISLGVAIIWPAGWIAIPLCTKFGKYGIKFPLKSPAD